MWQDGSTPRSRQQLSCCSRLPCHRLQSGRWRPCNNPDRPATGAAAQLSLGRISRTMRCATFPSAAQAWRGCTVSQAGHPSGRADDAHHLAAARGAGGQHRPGPVHGADVHRVCVQADLRAGGSHGVRHADWVSRPRTWHLLAINITNCALPVSLSTCFRSASVSISNQCCYLHTLVCAATGSDCACCGAAGCSR